MKPFKVGKVYKNEGGKDCTVLDVDYKRFGTSNVGILYKYKGRDSLHSDNLFAVDANGASPIQEMSLVPEKTVMERWINVYKHCEVGFQTYPTEEQARRARANEDYITTVKLTGEY